MRYLILIILCQLLLMNTSTAQAPEKFTYQAVVRDAANSLLVNQSIGMRIQILQGSVSGSSVYTETHTTQSNTNGLVTVEIGVGTVITGTFNQIDWAAGPYYIQTETDPTGGTNYTIVGTTQLLSVPYALHAKTAALADNVTNDLVNDADADPNNEIQALSISNDTVFLTGGGFVVLPAGFDGQYSSLTGAPTTLSSFSNDVGYLTTEIDSSVTNELQLISISNDTVFLSDGGYAVIPNDNDWVAVDSTLYNGNTGNVGIGTSSPSEKLDVAGNATVDGLQVGNGTMFSNMQGGKVTVGQSGGQTLIFVNVVFNTPFTGVPNVICTASNESGTIYDDSFNITVRFVTNTGFQMVVNRVDGETWGQSVEAFWMAFE